MQTAETRLRAICQSALMKTQGNTEKAYEIFNAAIIERNDAELERELCKAYRSAALRAWLAETYQAMRGKGLVPIRPRDIPIRGFDYDDNRREVRQKTWASQRTDAIKDRVEEERVAYEKRIVDVFRVNGEPIGDCTAEVVLQQADRHEHDTRFMRNLAHGVPPTGRIRDYKSAEDAEKAWRAASGPLPMTLMVKTLNKEIRTREEYDHWLAKQIETELSGTPDDRGRGIALDMIAHKLKTYEDYNWRNL